MNSAITFSIDTVCFKKFSKFALKRIQENKSQKRSFFINLVVWFFVAVLFMFVFQAITNKQFSIDWVSAAIGALPLLLFIIVYALNMIKLQNLIHPKKDGILLGEKTIEISEEGINEKHSLSHSFYSWDCIESILENQGDIYLFLDKMLALIIPATAFSSEAEKAEFRGRIEKYL